MLGLRESAFCEVRTLLLRRGRVCGLRWLRSDLEPGWTLGGVGALSRIGRRARTVEAGLAIDTALWDPTAPEGLCIRVVNKLPLVVVGLFLVNADGFLRAGARNTDDWTDYGAG